MVRIHHLPPDKEKEMNPTNKCLECGRYSGTACFCSIECACYSGTYSVNIDFEVSETAIQEYVTKKLEEVKRERK